MSYPPKFLMSKRSEYQKEYRKKNRLKLNRYKNEWAKNKRKSEGNIYYQKNKDKAKIASRKRYLKIKDDPVEKQRILETNRRWAKRNPEKREAHKQVMYALRRGQLNKMPCEVCGQTKVEAHHENYSIPLNVVWLCKKHHVEADIKRRGRIYPQVF